MTNRWKLLRYISLVLFAALVLASCKPAQPAVTLEPSPQAAHPTAAQSPEDRLRANVAYLASADCEGRLVGSVGDRRAASYIVDELQRLGVKPLWKSSFLQEFSVTNQANIQARLELLDEKGSIVRAFSYFNDFSEGLYPRWGVTTAEGKIAVVQVGNYSGLSEGTVALAKVPSSDMQSLIMSAYSARCAAVLVCDAALAEGDSPLKYMNRAPANVPFPVFRLQPKCYAALSAQTGSTVRLTVVSESVPSKQGLNVAGVVGNPSRQQTVVLCAHRDHMGTLADGTLFPGAIDNASGVSVVLEMARQLPGAGKDYAVVFLLTDSEEVGLDGARYFAENLPFPKKNLSVVLNLDCVGVHSQDSMELNAGGGEAASALASSLVASLSKEGIAAKVVEEPLGSDHQAFESAGIPAVGLLSSIDSFMDHLHNAKDTPDAVDPAKLAAITRAVASALTGLYGK